MLYLAKREVSQTLRDPNATTAGRRARSRASVRQERTRTGFQPSDGASSSSYPDAVSHTETGRPIRVVAIDDHPAILDAIDRAVSERETMTLIGVVRDRFLAERLIVELDPDVVVCDAQLGGNVDGLRLLERFAGRPRPIFLMLSAYDYPSLFRAAHERGAAGYLLKTSELGDVVEAIELVATGTTVIVNSARVIESPLPTR